jgi:ATP-dependent RNA helicase SUPV3L1/SUV3
MESLGALPRHEADGEIRSLTKDDRHALRKLGIRIGRHLVYIPVLLRPAAVELSVLLWAVFEDVERLAPPPAGRVSLKREKHEPEGWLRAAGFRPAGNLFVRADMLERMAELAWKKFEAAKGPFEAKEDFLSLAGCGVEELPGILKSLGFVPSGEEGKWQPRPRNRHPRAAKPQGDTAADGKTEDAKPNRRPHKPRRPAAGDNNDKAANAAKAKGKPARPAQQHAPRPVKIDPDSPFAKLQDFKFKK